MQKSLPPTTASQQRRYEKDRELGHRIPSSIINKIDKLKQVNYRAELTRFANEYKNANLADIEEEYDLVATCMTNLISHFFGQSELSEAIKRSMKANLFGDNLEDNYRDHFIHPFQVFLLGSMIIDRYYDAFQSWYEISYANITDNCLECAWFLTSVFHDRAKDVKLLLNILEPDFGTFGNKLPSEDQYLSFLSSYYNHKLSGHALSDWTQKATPNLPLKDILISRSETWAHGVKSAVLMLKDTCKNPDNVRPRDVASAFAIALHDRIIWDDLQKITVLPIQMELFPLSCLLLYLDAVQEWGRTAKPITNEEVYLINLSLYEDSVCCEVAFDNAHAASFKMEECEAVGSCFISPALELSMSIKVRLHQV